MPGLGLRIAMGSGAAWIAFSGLAAACEPRLAAALAEGSPRDVLRLENLSVADWSLARLEIDLSPSAGGIFFDSAAGGSGAAGWRELRVESGARLSAPATLLDGDARAAIAFEPFAPGARALLTLDMDSRGGGYEDAQILSLELAGAEATALFRDARGGEVETFGVFDDRGQAVLTPAACS